MSIKLSKIFHHLYCALANTLQTSGITHIATNINGKYEKQRNASRLVIVYMCVE